MNTSSSAGVETNLTKPLVRRLIAAIAEVFGAALAPQTLQQPFSRKDRVSGGLVQKGKSWKTSDRLKRKFAGIWQ